MSSTTIEHKIIPTDRAITSLISNRWSPRSFTDEAITQEQLNTILEAATMAFSANNSQPWHYAYAHKGTEGFEKIHQILAPGNQPWAINAAALMISFARKVNDNGTPSNWAQHDLGAANATLVLQALSMGIYAHLMAGFNVQSALEISGVDAEKWQPVAVIALGYKGSADDLEEPYKSRELAPRSRRNIAEISTAL